MSEKKIIEYKVVTKVFADDMSEFVTKEIENGFEPYGEMKFHKGTLAQALVKYGESE